jgi:hypothetical protein
MRPRLEGITRLEWKLRAGKVKIVTRLRREKDGDYFDVWREPHHSSGGDSLLLTSGRLDLKDKFPG